MAPIMRGHPCIRHRPTGLCGRRSPDVQPASAHRHPILTQPLVRHLRMHTISHAPTQPTTRPQTHTITNTHIPASSSNPNSYASGLNMPALLNARGAMTTEINLKTLQKAPGSRLLPFPSRRRGCAAGKLGDTVVGSCPGRCGVPDRGRGAALHLPSHRRHQFTPHTETHICDMQNCRESRQEYSGTLQCRVLISALHSDWLPARVAGSETVREVNCCASF